MMWTAPLRSGQDIVGVLVTFGDVHGIGRLREAGDQR